MSEESAPRASITELGRRLREERTRRGLTVQQVADRIHVAARYLEAIERGDEAGIPAQVYLRGFVTGYVRSLGLDETPFIRMVEEIRAASGQAVVPAPAEDKAERKRERGGRKRTAMPVLSLEWKRRVVTAGVVLLAGALVGLGIRGIIHLIGGSRRGAMPPSPFEVAGKPHEGGKPVSGAAKARAEAGERIAGKVVVSVTATMECWMESEVDGGQPVDFTMTPGENRYFHGKEKVRLLIGNAAGVLVSGPAGPLVLPTKQGKVLNILITRYAVERLRLEPRPSGTVSGEPSR